MSSPSSSANNPNLSDDDIQNLASLIVSGESPIPWDLPSDVLAAVLDRVHVLRRERLVSMIARVIARKIHQDRESP